MTTRAMLFGLCGLVALAACEATQTKEENERAQAQTEASEKAAKAQAEANEKAAKAQREADETAAKAQANANDAIRGADETMLKRHNDYRLTLQKDIDDVDKKIDDLKVKETKAVGRARTDADLAMKDVAEKRDMVENDMKNIDHATAAEWDAFKTKVDKDVAELKKSLDAVKL